MPRANTAGLVARAVIVDEEPINLMMSDKIVRLHLVEECVPRYVLIVNNHADFARQYYPREASGVSPSMKNVSRSVIVQMPLPLAPLAEQHRIVAKVDELMVLCDQLEKARTDRETKRDKLTAATLVRLNKLNPKTFRNDARFVLDHLQTLTTRPDQIKELRKTIFNLAVQGKLVDQDANDPPASHFLNGVALAIRLARQYFVNRGH